MTPLFFQYDSTIISRLGGYAGLPLHAHFSQVTLPSKIDTGPEYERLSLSYLAIFVIFYCRRSGCPEAYSRLAGRDSQFPDFRLSQCCN